MNAHEIIPDCLHIPGFLTDKEQLSLYNAASELSQKYTTTETCNAHSHYAEIASVDLTKYPPSSPHIEAFHSFLQKVCPAIDPHLWSFPESKLFTYLTAYLYPQTGKLAGHTDNIPGWLIIVGLGSAASFWVKGKDQADKVYITFRSGDIIAFNTSASASIFHGIDHIVPDSCPPFFPSQNRISLQFRETITTQLIPSSLSPHSSHSMHTPDTDLLFDDDDDGANLTTTKTVHLLPQTTHPSPDAPWTKLPFLSLPQNMVLQIFSLLDARELALISSTCRTHYNDPSHSLLWTHLYHSIINKEREMRAIRLQQARAARRIFFEMPAPDYFRFTPTLPTTTPKKLTRLKMMNRSDPPAMNIDFGSYQFRGGFCGEDTPYAMPARWGTDDKGSIVFGHRTSSNAKYEPLISNRVVQNYDHILNACEYFLVEKAEVLPPMAYILAQFSHDADKPNREKLTEVAFESLGISGWYTGSNYVLGTYASGKTTGAIIDIGYEFTSICFIYEGYAIPDVNLTLPLGGNHITKYFKQLVTRRYSGMDWEDEKFENFKEKWCFVNSTNHGYNHDQEATTYNEWDFSIGAERYQAAELLFNPSLLPETAQVKSLAESFVQQCHKYMQDEGSDRAILLEFYKNIIMVGGGSMLKGLGLRLENEIKKLAPKNTTVKVTADKECDLWPWRGGSILGSLTTFSKMWISRPEYEECGPSIVHRKCF